MPVLQSPAPEQRAPTIRTPGARAGARQRSPSPGLGSAPEPGLPGELNEQDRRALCALAGSLRTVDQGTRLFDVCTPLGALYQVADGAFKTCITALDGRTQIVGFQLPGDWLGMDAIDSGRHMLDAVALEDARVWALDYTGLRQLLPHSLTLQHAFHRLLSREIQRETGMLRLLGRLPADARLACFLLDQAGRLPPADSEAQDALVLHMSREDIGSYLGLQIETVSRSFSKLRHDGVLAVQHRLVHLLDRAALQRLAQEDPARTSVHAPLPAGA